MRCRWARRSTSRVTVRMRRVSSGAAAAGCGLPSGDVSAPPPGSVTRWRTTTRGHQPEEGSPGSARTSTSALPRRPSAAGSSAPPTKSGTGAGPESSASVASARAREPDAGGTDVQCGPSSSAHRAARSARWAAASARRIATPGSASSPLGGGPPGRSSTGTCSRCTRRRQRVVAAASSRTGRGAAAGAHRVVGLPRGRRTHVPSFPRPPTPRHAAGSHAGRAGWADH